MKLVNILSEVLKTNVFLADCIVATNRDVNLTDVLNNIRALPGVTIVNMVGKSKFISKQKEVAHVTIKFLPTTVGVLDYIKFLEETVRKYNEIYEFRVKKLTDFTKEQERKRKQKSRVYAIRKQAIVPEPAGPPPGRAFTKDEPGKKEG